MRGRVARPVKTAQQLITEKMQAQDVAVAKAEAPGRKAGLDLLKANGLGPDGVALDPKAGKQ